MKIICNYRKKKLCNVDEGTIIKACGEFYIVTDIYDSSHNQILGINIESGQGHYFDNDAVVEYYEAEVTIK